MAKLERKACDRFPDIDRIVAEAQLAVHEALMEHRRAGNPVAVWRDSKVVWIPPEEIPVDLPAEAGTRPAIRGKGPVRRARRRI